MRPDARVLAIVSHVVHYEHGGRLYAYGPYAREIDVWATLFPEVVIASPLRREPPPGDALPFERLNITMRPQRESGGRTFGAKLRQLALLPVLVRDVWVALGGADAIHVRCPGNLGLVGLLVAPLRAPRRGARLIAKYAGQWNGYSGEPLTVRLQRALLRSRWWRGPVTVYGRWPGSPPHVVPFFTSVMTRAQLARARASAAGRRPRAPLRVLFVGRLSQAKHVDVLVRAVAAAGDAVASCTIVGDGPERAATTTLAAALGLGKRVTFAGAVTFEQVLAFYEANDVLVLASETEGWPKAIAEAMAFGLVCVGADRGFVPEMLAEGRGRVVPPGDVQALAATLTDIASDDAAVRTASEAAAAWAQEFSLERLGEALSLLLRERWRGGSERGGATRLPRVSAS